MQAGNRSRQAVHAVHAVLAVQALGSPWGQFNLGTRLVRGKTGDLPQQQQQQQREGEGEGGSVQGGIGVRSSSRPRGGNNSSRPGGGDSSSSRMGGLVGSQVRCYVNGGGDRGGG